MDDERDPHDNYETPANAVHQLLSNVKLTGDIWDPSCGRGAIIKALVEAGINRNNVIGSDKYEYEWPRGIPMMEKPVDFLDIPAVPNQIVNIVMNPPFNAADEHVRHALRIVPSAGMVCVLLRLTWTAARKRADLLNHLWKIIMVGRLKMLPPDVPDKGHNGTVDFAWFVFVPHVVDSTIIVRAK